MSNLFSTCSTINIILLTLISFLVCELLNAKKCFMNWSFYYTTIFSSHHSPRHIVSYNFSQMTEDILQEVNVKLG